MLSQIIFFGLIAASIPLWVMLLQSLARGKSPLAPRLRIQSPFGILDVGIMFTCWIVSPIAAVSMAMLFIGVSPLEFPKLSVENEIALLVTVSVSQVLCTLLGLSIITLRYGYAPRIFGWQPEHFWSDLRIGTLAFIAIAPIIMTIQLILTQYVEYTHTTLSLLQDNPTAAGIAATWLMAVIVAPITEEIFFRGILQSWLQRQHFFGFEAKAEQIFGGWTRYRVNPNLDRGSMMLHQSGLQSYQPIKVYSDLPNQKRLSWSPIVISSLLFAGVHFGQGPAPIPLFVFGLALGYVYRQTGSILSCIVIHMLLNGITMLLVTAETLYQTG